MLGDLLDLVLPRSCVVCRGPGSVFCAQCRPHAEVHRVASPVGAVAAGHYVDPLRSVIVAYKERGRRDLAAPLARLLASAVAAVVRADGALDPRSVVLVAAPSSRAATAQRGGNHVERLARRVAWSLGCRVAPGVLRPARAVQDSAGLGIAERRANLHDSMRAAPGAGRRAVVVDDIVTTGATLGEARRALTAAGWRVSGAAVVAATPRLFPPGPGPPGHDPDR